MHHLDRWITRKPLYAYNLLIIFFVLLLKWCLFYKCVYSWSNFTILSHPLATPSYKLKCYNLEIYVKTGDTYELINIYICTHTHTHTNTGTHTQSVMMTLYLNPACSTYISRPRLWLRLIFARKPENTAALLIWTLRSARALIGTECSPNGTRQDFVRRLDVTSHYRWRMTFCILYWTLTDLPFRPSFPPLEFRLVITSV